MFTELLINKSSVSKPHQHIEYQKHQLHSNKKKNSLKYFIVTETEICAGIVRRIQLEQNRMIKQAICLWWKMAWKNICSFFCLTHLYV